MNEREQSMCMHVVLCRRIVSAQVQDVRAILIAALDPVAHVSEEAARAMTKDRAKHECERSRHSVSSNHKNRWFRTKVQLSKGKKSRRCLCFVCSVTPDDRCPAAIRLYRTNCNPKRGSTATLVCPARRTD
eukprot:1867052-Prymnesium_polylepis.2